MVDIIPGIGMSEKTWPDIETKIRLVAPHVEWVQIDMADGTLVPPVTFLDIPKFAPIIKELETGGKKVGFEAHLMVGNPEKYIRPLAEAGFKRIIGHIEANDPRLFLEQTQYESVETGLAIDGPTELEVIEPFFEEIDVVLVMMAEAGASGLTLQAENVEKVRSIRNHFADLPIEVDEGINEKTIRVIAEAGATRAVVTSYIFKTLTPDAVGHAIATLKK
ncbi:hypothetical protein M1555_01905 [Patescibacteria group bacterium]|nr:hypothetical protein [Patescibacteria group bacterium]